MLTPAGGWTSGNAPGHWRRNHSPRAGLAGVAVVVAAQGQGLEQPGLRCWASRSVRLQGLTALRQHAHSTPGQSKCWPTWSGGGSGHCCNCTRRRRGWLRPAGRCAPAGRWHCPGHRRVCGVDQGGYREVEVCLLAQDRTDAAVAQVAHTPSPSSRKYSPSRSSPSRKSSTRC